MVLPATALTLSLLYAATTPGEVAAVDGAPTQLAYREMRPEPTPLRRGLLSVPRWSLLVAGACVIGAGVLGLVRMRRKVPQ